MIRCKEVARLLSTGELSAAPRRTRLAVRFHLMMCDRCGRFAGQLAWLARNARELVRSFEQDESAAGLEARLLQRLGLE